MNAVAYLRVSSASQSLVMQRDAIERAAERRGDRIVEWHEEKMTGAKLERPVLGNLREAVRQGRVARLYVYRLDRLTRSGIRDTLDVVDEISRGGCELVTIGDGFDMAGPGRTLVVAVLAWAAQMERDAIGERIRAARAQVEAKGGAWGRPKRMAREEVAKAIKMHADGHSIREISAQLRVPRATLARALSQKGTYGVGAKSRVVRSRVARPAR